MKSHGTCVGAGIQFARSRRDSTRPAAGPSTNVPNRPWKPAFYPIPTYYPGQWIRWELVYERDGRACYAHGRTLRGAWQNMLDQLAAGNDGAASLVTR